MMGTCWGIAAGGFSVTSESNWALTSSKLMKESSSGTWEGVWSVTEGSGLRVTGWCGLPLWRTCSTVGVLSGLSRPARICQFDDIIVSGLLKLMVSKKSSYRQWNCGETRPVSRLRTRLTLRACCGEGPRFIPSLDLGDHLGILPPAAKALFNAYTGHPKVWLWRMLNPTWTPENFSSLEVPFFSTGAVL